MKKTHSANIGGTIFNVEEDAYTRLESYLESVKAHFRAYPDNSDIIADIEGRIAEQLLEGKSAGSEKIVALADVERVIAAMGTAEEFGDAGSVSSTPHAQTTRSERKLFRDEDDKILAGVASGIAAYFGVPVLPVRLLFLASLFMFGTSLLAYLVLWMLVPAAKTTTDKLKMRGDPVTLESVERGVREGIAAIPFGARSTASKLAVMIGTSIRVFVIGLAWIVGVSLVVAAVGCVVILSIYLVTTLANPEILPGNIRFPVAPEVLGWMYYPFLILSYFIFVLPLFCVIAVAVNVHQRKSAFNARAGLGMLGVFLISVLLWVIIWVTFYPNQRYRVTRMWTMMADGEDYPPPGRRRVSVDTTVSVVDHPMIDLALVQGRIQVNTWSRHEVKIVATAGDNRYLDLNLSPANVRIYDRKSRHCYTCYGETFYEVTVPAGATVDAKSVSGGIYVNGVSGPVYGKSVSGRIRVVLPDTMHASIHAESVSGGITSDFPVNTNGNASHFGPIQSVSIPVNGGGAQVDLKSVSGSITIGKVATSKQ